MWKLVQFSSKQCCFLQALRTWVLGRRLHRPQPKVSLPATRHARRVNYKPLKILTLLFFIYLNVEININLSKTTIFYFWLKAMILPNPFSRGILWNIGFTKNAKDPTLNPSIWKTKTNSNEKLKLFKDNSIFFKTMLCFCTFYQRGYTAGGLASYKRLFRCQLLALRKELRVYQKSFWICFFFLFLLKMSGNIREISIFHFWAKAVLLLNPFGTGILWKIRNTKKLKHLIFLSLKLREIHSKNSKLLKVHWIFIKTMLFFARFINVGKQQDAPSPRTPDVTACGLRWWKS